MNAAGVVGPTLPPWLKVKLPGGFNYERLKRVSVERRLHTVCEEARCPNIAECWGVGTATFMVLGKACTRGCRFCSVASAARPAPPDPEEPENLARTIRDMNLDYIVLTTVCRDDLPDQGAAHVAAAIEAVKNLCPKTKVEVLMQDFRGDPGLIERVLSADPEVAAHNIETVERLTPLARDARAGYRQSLEVLGIFRALRPQTPTKSSIFLGLGESQDEVLGALEDLRGRGVSFLTIGQYLRPSSSKRHLPVEEFVSPERFDSYAEAARKMGFSHVASGPLVRSSYRASEAFIHGFLNRDGA